jgi:hypothetical protein
MAAVIYVTKYQPTFVLRGKDQFDSGQSTAQSENDVGHICKLHIRADDHRPHAALWRLITEASSVNVAQWLRDKHILRALAGPKVSAYSPASSPYGAGASLPTAPGTLARPRSYGFRFGPA